MTIECGWPTKGCGKTHFDAVDHLAIECAFEKVVTFNRDTIDMDLYRTEFTRLRGGRHKLIHLRRPSEDDPCSFYKFGHRNQLNIHATKEGLRCQQHGRVAAGHLYVRVAQREEAHPGRIFCLLGLRVPARPPSEGEEALELGDAVAVIMYGDSGFGVVARNLLDADIDYAGPGPPGVLNKFCKYAGIVIPEETVCLGYKVGAGYCTNCGHGCTSVWGVTGSGYEENGRVAREQVTRPQGPCLLSALCAVDIVSGRSGQQSRVECGREKEVLRS